MESETNARPAHQEKCRRRHGGGNVSGGAYGLAFIGALVYFIQQAETFGQGALGVLKAIIWPALVTYNLLEFLKI